MTCMERSGFLFAHGCDRPASLGCGICGKTICTEHAREVEGRMLCVSCARQDPTATAAASPDDPYWYRDRHPTVGAAAAWDADDAAVFDSASGGAAAVDAGGDADGDFTGS